MIVYFSATGNSAFVANKIATALYDKAVSIENFEGAISLKDGENLGIITPVYYWGLPSIVEDFLQRVKIINAQNSYIYLVATCGGTTGQVDYFVNEYLKKKDLKLSASYFVETVDTWTVGFNVNDKEEVNKLLENELKSTQEIILSIKEKRGSFIDKGRKSIYMSKKARYFYNKARKTKRFNLESGCIGCGLCERNCPLGAIKIKDGKPTWVLDSCAICFRCLHNCPTFSIQYGKKTKKNGQYVHP